MNAKFQYRPSSFSILATFISLVIVGASLLPLLNVQLTPSRSLPRLTVSYYWADASARVIEQEVTSRLEGVFSSVKGVQDVSSVSSKGSGQISLSFKKNVNLDAARFEVASLIRQVYPELPEQVSFPTLSVGASGKNTSPILTYTLNSSASPYFIQKYAEDHLVPKLSLVPGVSGVNVYGSTPFEWEIRYNSDLIQTLGITSSDIAQGISNYFRDEYLGQGLVEKVDPGAGLVTGYYLAGLSTDSVNWSVIPVKKVNGRLVMLGDLAKVTYREQAPSTYYRINGLNTINMVIYPDENVNNVKLGKVVKEEAERLKETLPAGYSMLLASDTTQYLNEELSKIGQRTVFSLLILLIFVLLISREFKYLLLIVISIVANLSIACIFYYAFKVEVHLYTLAGITISFGMVIDSSIIMIDHIRRQGNLKAFLAVLAATLTTIGALSVIFFLEESQKVNLVEFAQVIITNLGVSMIIALFFIPALMDKIRLKTGHGSFLFRRKRRSVRLSRFYLQSILFSKRFKWIYILLFVLGFGIPVQWLPAKIEKEGRWPDIYNKTLGSGWFNEKARPIVEKALGGSLRLFTEDVFNSSFYSEPTRTTLHAQGHMPEGCTVQQLNEAVVLMENFLSKFDEIEQFQTSIYSYNNSYITIHFKPEFEDGSFPYFLKEEMTSKAINLGGMDWDIYGVGRGFSNALGTSGKSVQISLEGYNYDQLYRYAELTKSKLEENERVKGVVITGSSGWNAKTLYEYYIDFDEEALGMNQVAISQFYSFLQDKVYRGSLSPVFIGNEYQPVSLVSDSYAQYNAWDLRNRPVAVGDKQLKLANFGSLAKQNTGNEIYKNNQQYRLNVAYDFLGASELSRIVKDRIGKEMSDILPLGYSVSNQNQYGTWNRENKTQYYLILLVILIIYFICAILLESLLQPLAIILMIPVSFIGVFLTFYLFEFNFDQGGFASFILLCGIVVNAGLYIINDYNNFCRDKDTKDDLKLYMKAFNHKIIPVFLTVISTVLGLVPFVWSGQNEVFWFAFAVGAMGGLIFSMVAVLVYLPMFIRFKKKRLNHTYK